MVSITAKLFAAFALLASVGANNHGHVRERDSTALVLSSAQEERGDSCDECQLVKQEEGPQDSPPEFVPTHEWQDILPNQAIPPGLYIRVNLATGKKEAKLLD